MSLVTLAIPTYNNPGQLTTALMSLVKHSDFHGRVIVVHNGEPCYDDVQRVVPYELDWYDAGENLGWMGGINKALSMTETEYFCMMNDDVLFPPPSESFWHRQLKWLQCAEVGGVGPSSNYVAGYQNAFALTPHPVVLVPFLIGFCATYRTKLLKELGGLDESLPGGDDLDLSIRVKDAGWDLIADRRSYLHHIGGQTGQRLFPGQWDSQFHQADTYNALIHKHGLKRWWDMVYGVATATKLLDPRGKLLDDSRRANDALAQRYYKLVLEPSDMDEHMETLFRFASGCRHIVETGTNDATSTTALLFAQPDTLDCYDLVRFRDVTELEQMAGRTKFTFHLGDVLEAEFPDDVDMWFCDDLHTGEHLRMELEKFAWKVKKYIAFHDVSLFGQMGENGTEGIWPAISDFMRANPQWTIVHMTEKQNGMVILAR